MFKENKVRRAFFVTIVFVLTLGLVGCSQASYFELHGPSMEPNFPDGQVVEVEPVAVTELQRGDVIVFVHDGATYIKRLIALPGETVGIKSDVVYIDDVALDESYIAVPPTNEPPLREYEPTTLQADEYFVLGDNRHLSKDSSFYGPISGNDIHYRVVNIIDK